MELVQFCQLTLQQSGSATRARVNQAAVTVIFVRFNPANDDFTICVVVAMLLKE